MGKRAWVALLAMLGVVVNILMQVSSHDAASNLCSWFKGWDSCSNWIPPDSISSVVPRFGWVAITCAFAYIAWPSVKGYLLAPSLTGSSPPSSPIDSITNAELKERAREYTAQIRMFEATFKENERRAFDLDAEQSVKPGGAPLSAEDMHKQFFERQRASGARSSKRLTDWLTRYKSEGSILRAELLRRTGMFEDSEQTRRKTMALDPGMLAGISPISDLADYLDGLAARLR